MLVLGRCHFHQQVTVFTFINQGAQKSVLLCDEVRGSVKLCEVAIVENHLKFRMVRYELLSGLLDTYYLVVVHDRLESMGDSDERRFLIKFCTQSLLNRDVRSKICEMKAHTAKVLH